MTVLGSVDLGYRIVLATDGVCSSSDEGYDAFMTLCYQRFSEQIEMTTAEEALSHWGA